MEPHSSDAKQADIASLAEKVRQRRKMEARSSEAKQVDIASLAECRGDACVARAGAQQRRVPWRSFVLHGFAGLVFGALAVYLALLDAGRPQDITALFSRPLGLAALLLLVASVAAIILRSRIAIGVAAYVAIALAAYVAIGGLLLALSPVDHTAWLRLVLSLVMLLWSLRLIIATRFLRA